MSSFVLADLSNSIDFHVVPNEFRRKYKPSRTNVCSFIVGKNKGDISIGDNVIFGPGVKIFSENHSFKLFEKVFRLQEEIRNKVVIGNNVWIGSNSIILPGVTIEDNAVIAAGSVVNKNINNGTLNGGIPAKQIKTLN